LGHAIRLQVHGDSSHSPSWAMMCYPASGV